MKYCRNIILVLASAAAAATQPAAAILPKQFGGWEMQGTPKTSKDPATADQVNAPILKEYGFTDFASANYAREDGRKLALRAARFQDTSGAYGAFTFYKQPEMLNEKIGDQASSLNNRVLFYSGNVLVDAVFAKVSAMSAAELRELATLLPQSPSGAGKLPGLPAYLPKQSYVKNTAKYIVGPRTLEKIGAPIPSSLVDFDTGAEVVIGNYDSSGGEATLMLINYPTPQIAAERLRKIDAARQQNPPQPGNAALSDSPQLFDKRTGPIVVVAAGPLSASDAQSLLASVNYDADVTWNENTHLTKRDNLANLLVNIIILCFILIGFAMVAGLAFGGLRILVKHFFPDRVFDRSDEMEFISLHLSERLNDPPAHR